MLKVFVYGTLRRGERNDYLLKDAKCLAEQAWTNGVLFDTGMSYPALAPSNSSIVYGELYEVSDTDLARLDELEGYQEGGVNNLYNRLEQIIYTDKGKYRAYVYVAHLDSLLKKKISNGDWKEYNLLKQNDSFLYFAYGSCMDSLRFKKAGVERYFKEVVGVGVLPNYSLKFTHRSTFDGLGRADIVEDGGVVEGKIYKIDREALNYLYGREGAPHVYRPTFVRFLLDGLEIEALTFTVKRKQEEVVPPIAYEMEILRGAKGYLSEDYVSSLVKYINILKNTSKIGGM
ncbi:gamma-glutamylcyclotransferase [Ornithinibacillus halotolerans]|uniref:Gamma-glutamylcyclotransferase family protein n=1 Tax=Ornithinibacillus halotolerans TaxID=1274357 RepID=A0A916WEC0_9BACI|nr:gamma-glutamylcyclotransferase [Ornithinibacillus halotolerans]GGA90315.1 putative gamma-glutamylcyclotransferase YkqA [Ornithinibacillus halotolerans]